MSTPRIEDMKHFPTRFLNDADIIRLATTSRGLFSMACENRGSYPPIAKAYFTYRLSFTNAFQFRNHILDYSSSLSRQIQDEEKACSEIYEAVLTTNKKHQNKYTENVLSALTKLDESKKDITRKNLTELDQHFNENTVLVVTHTERYKFGMEYKHCFELSTLMDFREIDRWQTEFSVLLKGCPQLARHLLDIHPQYASLQFIENLQALELYGNHFFVSRNKKNAIACRGDTMSDKEKIEEKFRYHVALEKNNFAGLFNQFPINFLDMCSNTQAPNLRKEGQNLYIEVQRWGRFNPNDPNDVQVWHFNFEKNIPSLNEFHQHLKTGVQVTLGENPFNDKRFTDAFKQNNINQFVLNELKNNIYQTVVYLTASTEEHIVFKADEKALNFTFKITKNGSGMHQVQVGGVLCRMGAQGYFEMRGAFGLCHDIKDVDDLGRRIIKYTLPLTGLPHFACSFLDHDAYTHDQFSLSGLLNKFLHRVVSNILVSHQNDQHLRKTNKPHPVTGRGATEEQNQIHELSLFMDNEPYTIVVHWYFDRVFIEVNTKLATSLVAEYVASILSPFLNNKLNTIGNKIYIQMPLKEMLGHLAQHRKEWYVIVWHCPNTGKYYLANHHNYGISGYGPEGNHQDDPFHFTGLGKKSEYGEPNLEDQKYADVLSKCQLFKTTKQPAVNYFKAPISILKSINLNTEELVPNSLCKFNVYELGNLRDDQLKIVAASFKLSITDYKLKFQNRLPLRPLPAIIERVKSDAMELNDYLQKLYPEVKLNIATDYEMVKGYWLPKNNFGLIEICGDNSTLSVLYEKYTRLYPDNEIRLEKTLTMKMNPAQVNLTVSLAREVDFNETKDSEQKSCIKKETFSVDDTIDDIRNTFENMTPDDLCKQYEKINVGCHNEKNVAILSIFAKRMLALVMAKRISSSSLYDQGEKLLSFSVGFHEFEIVKYLVENKIVSPLVRNSINQSILYRMICYDEFNFNIFSYLLSATERQLKESHIPEEEIIDLLTKEKKSRTFDKDSFPISHLMLVKNHLWHVSEVKQFEEQFKTILNMYKPSLKMLDGHGNSLLHAVAKFYDDIELLTYLVGQGLDVNCVNDKGETILHAAIDAGNFIMTSAILETYPHLYNVADKNNLTPFPYAFSLAYSNTSVNERGKPNMDRNIDFNVLEYLLNYEKNHTIERLEKLIKVLDENNHIHADLRSIVQKMLKSKIAQLSSQNAHINRLFQPAPNLDIGQTRDLVVNKLT